MFICSSFQYFSCKYLPIQHNIYSKEQIATWLHSTLLTEHHLHTTSANHMKSNWNLNHLSLDQKEVVLLIMSKIKEWINWNGTQQFSPLQLTVCGKPGTGKSVIIKTIYNICYCIFKNLSCVQVCAPTGGVAYNADGQTCH